MENKPTTLEECYAELEKLKDMEDWCKETEKQAVALVHDGLGRWMRNNWGLWDDSSELHKYFNKMGIKHADDMSSIILTTFHRIKNNVDIDIESLLQRNWKHWSECDKALLPHNIDGVEEKYLKMFKKFEKTLDSE